VTQTLQCAISRTADPYQIEIGSGLVARQTPFLRSLAAQFAIITDQQVAIHHGHKLAENLRRDGLSTHLFSFPTGERYKTRETKEHLENQLFEQGLGRDTCIIALGGGVVTDLAGYVAATYCRGLPLVMMPTSLLAMVDASVGGKTGVNVPYGKNMLGCVYQPKKVVIDLALLHSLPKQELMQGVVEMLKHGVIADETLFTYLETQAQYILNLNDVVLEKVIFDSCRIKKEIVEQDEQGLTKRHWLNFGHTVGHALECLSDYSLPHGEAVAIGMLVEAHLSMQAAGLSPMAFERIRVAFERYGLPLHLPREFPVDEMLDAIALDKKSLRGRPRFVLTSAIGCAPQCTHVEESLLRQALQWMTKSIRLYRA